MISVILNYFNEEKYLSQAIDSILDQTYQDFELIIVDDASSDGSIDIAKSYDDSRIKIIVNDSNKGLPFSRNVGIYASKGEYIAFADADDISLPNRLEKEKKYLDNNSNVLAVSCRMDFLSEEGVIRKNTDNKTNSLNEIRARLLFEDPIANPGSMIRRTVFEEYGIFQNEKLKTSEDYEFWLRVIQKGDIYVLPDTLLLYRVHESKFSNFRKNNQDLYDSIMKNLFCYAWKSRGFNITDRDINFIYNYFYSKRQIWKVSAVMYLFGLSGRVKKQLENLNLNEKNEINKILREKIIYSIIYCAPYRIIKRKISGWL